MASPKKKSKLTANDVEIGNRTLEAVLIDLAERSARAEERSARAEERSARAEELSARAEYRASIALESIAALTKDLRATVAEMRAANERVDARFGALEKVTGS